MSRKNFLPDGVLFQKEKAGFVEKVSLNIIIYGNGGNMLKYNMEDDTMNGNARAYSYLTGKGVVNMKKPFDKKPQTPQEKAELFAKQSKRVHVGLLEAKMWRIYRGKYSRLAKAAGMNLTTLRNKVQGKTPFNAQEIAVLTILLDLNPQEVFDIFINGYLMESLEVFQN